MYRLIILLITAIILGGCSTQQSAKAITEENVAPAIVVTDDFGYKVAVVVKHFCNTNG